MKNQFDINQMNDYAKIFDKIKFFLMLFFGKENLSHNCFETSKLKTIQTSIIFEKNMSTFLKKILKKFSLKKIISKNIKIINSKQIKQ